MEIRNYQSGDEEKILELFQLSFGKPMKESYWKWRFLDNPENIIMIKLMWDGDILAGHYAVSPLKLNYNNDHILSALSMTTMTHPEYSGRGIFSRLADQLYRDELKANELKAVWGYPNNNSHYAFIKNLSWNNLEVISTFSVNVDIIRTADAAPIKNILQFTEGNIEALKKSTQNFPIKAEKNIDTLNWRYLQNPLNKYEVFELEDGGLKHFAVTKLFPSFTDKGKYEIDIVEFHFPADYDALLRLTNAIKNYYSQYNLSQINTWMPLNDLKHIQMEKIGFQHTVPLTYSGIKILDKNMNTLGNNRDWHYSMGDSDIY